MFTNIRPSGIGCCKRTRTRKKTPVDDGDDKRERDDGREEDRMRQLEGTIPFVERGASRKSVEEGVEGSKEEVEC